MFVGLLSVSWANQILQAEQKKIEPETLGSCG